MLTLLRKAIGRPELSRLPWTMLAVSLALVGVGALFITSAQSLYMCEKQLIFAGLGVVAFFCTALFEYRHLRGLTLPLYLLGLASLALLPVLGVGIESAPGVQRWYDLGVVRVQPSELMKVITVLALADLLERLENPEIFT